MRGRSLLRTKSIEQSIEDTEDEHNGLRRALGPLDLLVFGVAVIIGTIFVLTGTAAGTLAGPAVALSFVSAGTTRSASPCRPGSTARTTTSSRRCSRWRFLRS